MIAQAYSHCSIFVPSSPPRFIITDLTCVYFYKMEKVLTIFCSVAVEGWSFWKMLQFDSYGVDVRKNGVHEDGQWYMYKCRAGAGDCSVAIGQFSVSWALRSHPRLSIGWVSPSQRGPPPRPHPNHYVTHSLCSTDGDWRDTYCLFSSCFYHTGPGWHTWNISCVCPHCKQINCYYNRIRHIILNYLYHACIHNRTESAIWEYITLLLVTVIVSLICVASYTYDCLNTCPIKQAMTGYPKYE